MKYFFLKCIAPHQLYPRYTFFYFIIGIACEIFLIVSPYPDSVAENLLKVSGKKGGGVGGPLMSSTPNRPASQSSEPERVARRERRKSIDERSDRGSEYGGRKGSTKSPGPGGVLSRLEQHERMLAERERERREHQRLVSLGRAPSRGELRPRSVTETESDRDLPSYMRSTSASSKKEKLTGGPGPGPGVGPAERSRRRSSSGHTQSQGDLRRISGDLQDTSSEEDASWTKHRAASTDRRHLGERQAGPGRAKSERDLSRVARVNLGGGSSSRDGGATPVQKARAKMKTTTIISNDGAVVVKHPEPQYSARGTEAVDVTRAPLSRQLAEVRITVRL